MSRVDRGISIKKAVSNGRRSQQTSESGAERLQPRLEAIATFFSPEEGLLRLLQEGGKREEASHGTLKALRGRLLLRESSYLV
jgi:hypothetical protein